MLAIPIVITHGELVWIGIDAAIAGGVTEGAPCWSAAFAGGGIALMVRPVAVIGGGAGTAQAHDTLFIKAAFHARVGPTYEELCF